MTKGGDGDEPLSSSGVTCAAVPVDVEGKQAVWIFTEFETGESLKNLRDWLIPDHWPDWGGEMFKEMRPISSVDLRPTQGDCPTDPFQVPRGRRDRRPPARDRAALRVQVDPDVGGHQPTTSTAASGTCSRSTAATSWRPTWAAAVTSRHSRSSGSPTPCSTPSRRQVCPEWSIWVQRADEGGRGPGRRRLRGPEARLGRRLGPQGLPVRRGRRRVHRRRGRSSGSAPSPTWWTSTPPSPPTSPSASGRASYGRVDAANDTTRLFQRLARDWSRRLAGGHGQHVQLGRGDRPTDGRRGSGEERPHHRAHDADGEGTVRQGTREHLGSHADRASAGDHQGVGDHDHPAGDRGRRQCLRHDAGGDQQRCPVACTRARSWPARGASRPPPSST